MRQIEKAKQMKVHARTIFPVLQKFKSPIEAQIACQVLPAVMNSLMNSYWSDCTISDLDLSDKLTTDDDLKDREIYKELVTAISDLSIPEALELFQGMSGALDGYMRILAKDKVMADVKVEEIVND